MDARGGEALLSAPVPAREETEFQEMGKGWPLGPLLPLRLLSYTLYHHGRLFMWAPLVGIGTALHPKAGALSILTYVAVHRQRWWQRAVHGFFRLGGVEGAKVDDRYAHLIQEDRRYLFSLHPHSVLADGWGNVIVREVEAFESDRGPGWGMPTRPIHLCFAPIIQHVPVHGELYRDRCGGVTEREITQVWKTPRTDPAVIPGGFAEATFSNAGDKTKEYSYLKGRSGFVRVAIKHGKDIVPVYSYRSTHMYKQSELLRGWRARFSQHYFLGIVWPIGKWGTMLPLTDDTTTMVFPPFPASAYSLDQVAEAHRDYCAHLKWFFDLHKAEHGMAGAELTFVGKDFVDDDLLSKALLKMRLISPPRSRL